MNQFDDVQDLIDTAHQIEDLKREIAELQKALDDTIRQAETMAANGASATHIIELFRALKGKP